MSASEAALKELLETSFYRVEPRQIRNEMFRITQRIALIITQHDDGRGVRGDSTIGTLWADLMALQEIFALLHPTETRQDSEGK